MALEYTDHQSPLKPRATLMMVWSSLFIVQMFADLIEGAFFTTRISSLSIFLGGMLLSLVITFLEAASGVLLFPQRSDLGPTSRLLLKPYFTQKPWILRLVLGSIAYFPIYFLFGGLVSPIVLPYYTDPSLGLGLKIPDLPTLVSIELLRGLLFTIALVPIAVTVRLSRRDTFLWLASYLYVVGAFIPFVAGSTLPWILRSVHSLEILSDSIVYGAVLTYLFKRGASARIAINETETLEKSGVVVAPHRQSPTR